MKSVWACKKPGPASSVGHFIHLGLSMTTCPVGKPVLLAEQAHTLI